MLDRVHPDVDLPRRGVKHRIHRRERDDIGQRGTLQPCLIMLVIGPHRHRSDLDLCIRRVPDFGIEQIMIACAYRLLFKRTVVSPPCTDTES